MTYNIYKFLFAFLIVSAFACSNDSILDQMETIKTVGNEEPQKALCMLDSIENEVRDGNADYAGRMVVIGTDLKEDELAKLFHVQ